jgi:uncharacterized protein
MNVHAHGGPTTLPVVVSGRDEFIPTSPPDSTPEWPAGLLDVAALAGGGWRPTPFRQYILKLHSRCNLACDYCYLYAMADQSWRTKPVTMAPDTITQAARRIAEAARRHGLAEVCVVFHGGEPLLAGADLIAFAAAELRTMVPAGTAVRLSLQTNAVLLTPEVLGVLLDHDVSVGVSMDGDGPAHDRHRRYRNGRGSHQDTVRGVALLAADPFRRLFAGILCTIDLAADPIVTYDALAVQGPPVIDFLLPHGNWTRLPPARGPDSARAPYADWLIAIFDRWYPAPERRVRVRLFEEIIHLCLGGSSRHEAVGLSPVGLIVIDTDGSLEQVDTLKSAFSGAAATGLNVFEHGFDAALAHPSIAARQIGAAALSDTCGHCSLRRICGGGYYPHRYREGSGFRNPSVYCPDLTKLIIHIQRRLAADLDALLPAGR